MESVIQAYVSTVNCDCSDEDEEDYPRVSTQVFNRNSSVSKRMIDQFFTQEEEQDQDWLYDDSAAAEYSDHE